MVCRGLCDRYKAKKRSSEGRYASGQRRCQGCMMFLNWSGLWCPCCGERLRTKPRASKYKAKYNEATKKTFGIEMKDE